MSTNEAIIKEKNSTTRIKRRGTNCLNFPTLTHYTTDVSSLACIMNKHIFKVKDMKSTHKQSSSYRGVQLDMGDIFRSDKGLVGVVYQYTPIYHA